VVVEDEDEEEGEEESVNDSILRCWWEQSLDKVLHAG
jgi:hypothetical protein